MRNGRRYQVFFEMHLPKKYSVKDRDRFAKRFVPVLGRTMFQKVRGVRKVIVKKTDQSAPHLHALVEGGGRFVVQPSDSANTLELIDTDLSDVVGRIVKSQKSPGKWRYVGYRGQASGYLMDKDFDRALAEEGWAKGDYERMMVEADEVERPVLKHIRDEEDEHFDMLQTLRERKSGWTPGRILAPFVNAARFLGIGGLRLSHLGPDDEVKLFLTPESRAEWMDEHPGMEPAVVISGDGQLTMLFRAPEHRRVSRAAKSAVSARFLKALGEHNVPRPDLSEDRHVWAARLADEYARVYFPDDERLYRRAAAVFFSKLAYIDPVRAKNAERFLMKAALRLRDLGDS